MEFLNVTSQVKVPLEEFEFTFSRSAGPGGQNVNKVNSKARLRWRVIETHSLGPDVRERFFSQNRHRITTEGDFLISSQRFRDQERNVADCLEKLQTLLATAAVRPTPRKATKATRGSHRRRLAQKKNRSTVKELRRRPGSQD